MKVVLIAPRSAAGPLAVAAEIVRALPMLFTSP